MAKKIVGFIKLQVPAGKANPIIGAACTNPTIASGQVECVFS